MSFVYVLPSLNLPRFAGDSSSYSEALLTLNCVLRSGVTLQVAAVNSAMFTIGRIITFAMTGMAIVVVPIYQAETCPTVLRGMFASTIQLLIILGQVIASIVTYGSKNINSDAGWRIPTGLQLLMPTFIFALLPFVPESPRWLLSRDRRDDACQNLRKLRKHASEEDIQFEIEALSYAHANEEQGTWAEVFDKSNRVSQQAPGWDTFAAPLYQIWAIELSCLRIHVSLRSERLLRFLECSANKLPAKRFLANIVSSSTCPKGLATGHSCLASFKTSFPLPPSPLYGCTSMVSAVVLRSFSEDLSWQSSSLFLGEWGPSTKPASILLKRVPWSHH